MGDPTPTPRPEAPEFEYAWEVEETHRAQLTPRGPRYLLDDHPHTPEEIAAFPRGRRVRRRKAGQWEPDDETPAPVHTDSAIRALEAVRAIHAKVANRPGPDYRGEFKEWFSCAADNHDWPCPTRRAIDVHTAEGDPQ